MSTHVLVAFWFFSIVGLCGLYVAVEVAVAFVNDWRESRRARRFAAADVAALRRSVNR